jgi:TPR repeat protein
MNSTFRNYLLATSCLVVSLACSFPSMAMDGKEEIETPAATSTLVTQKAASPLHPSSIANSIPVDVNALCLSFIRLQDPERAGIAQQLETAARAGNAQAQEFCFRMPDFATLQNEMLSLGWAQKQPWAEERIAKMIKSSDKKIQTRAHLFLYNREENKYNSIEFLDKEHDYGIGSAVMFLLELANTSEEKKEDFFSQFIDWWKQFSYAKPLLDAQKCVPGKNAITRVFKRRCLLSAALRGNLTAMNELGCFLQRGTEEDKEDSIPWLERAAENGYAKSMYNLWCVDGTIKWLRKAAENGYAVAMNSLGFLLVQGGTEEELQEAIHWFREAAKKGDLNARVNLVGLDGSAEAIQWATEEAQAGSVHAMRSLGFCYELGQRDRNPNLKKAIEWHKKAADKGDAWAFTGLGRCYLKKSTNLKKPRKFLSKAHFYFTKAMELGDQNAAVFLQQAALPAETELPATQAQDDALAQALEASLCPTTSMSAGHREEKQDESASSPATSSASLASTSATSSASLASTSISSSASLASSEQVASSDSDDDSDEDPKAAALLEQAPEEVAVVDPATSIKNAKYLRALLKNSKEAYETAVAPLQRSEERIGILKRDCHKPLEHLQSKTRNVPHKTMHKALVGLFSHGFFNKMVTIKETANGVMVKVPGYSYLTTSTHRPHDQAAGYDLHFIRDINRILALFGVRGA